VRIPNTSFRLQSAILSNNRGLCRSYFFERALLTVDDREASLFLGSLWTFRLFMLRPIFDAVLRVLSPCC